MFHIGLYAAAQSRAASDGFVGTDDNELIEHLGYRVQMVECSKENLKVTTPDDMRLAGAILAARHRDEKA